MIELEQPKMPTSADGRARLTVDPTPFLGRSCELGFLGSMPIDDQIDNALGFLCVAELVGDGTPSRFADLGTGGGVPGAILSCCWPEAKAYFFDSNERRTAFLQEESDGGALGDVHVVRGRLEEIAREDEYLGNFPLVTSRSFGTPSVTAECAAPLLTVGGSLVVSEPPDESAGRRWSKDGLAELGLEPTRLIRWDDRFTYQVITKIAETPTRYPRRVGIPAKRPLF